jgi:hypothetical protein
MRRWRNEDEEDEWGRMDMDGRDEETLQKGELYILSTCYGMVLVWYHTVP